MDFRQIILAELARQKKSRYWLAEACADQVSRRTTYGYLAGKTRIADDKLSILLSALSSVEGGLAICANQNLSPPATLKEPDNNQRNSNHHTDSG